MRHYSTRDGNVDDARSGSPRALPGTLCHKSQNTCAEIDLPASTSSEDHAAGRLSKQRSAETAARLQPGLDRSVEALGECQHSSYGPTAVTSWFAFIGKLLLRLSRVLRSGKNLHYILRYAAGCDRSVERGNFTRVKNDRCPLVDDDERMNVREQGTVNFYE